MSEWPTDPTDVIKEALREYVGDGDGADELVLARHNARVIAEELEEAVERDRLLIPDALGYRVAAVFVESLLERADRIRQEAGLDALSG